jgi:hypothetical protein
MTPEDRLNAIARLASVGFEKSARSLPENFSVAHILGFIEILARSDGESCSRFVENWAEKEQDHQTKEALLFVIASLSL